jgi:threonine dehydrogenase-like Zn-dependent dehydrogenase
MKAVILHGPENYPNNYEVMDIEKPSCGKKDILLKMKAAALCGTDKRIFTGGKTKGVRPDSVVGHEICAGKRRGKGTNIWIRPFSKNFPIFSRLQIFLTDVRVHL